MPTQLELELALAPELGMHRAVALNSKVATPLHLFHRRPNTAPMHRPSLQVLRLSHLQREPGLDPVSAQRGARLQARRVEPKKLRRTPLLSTDDACFGARDEMYIHNYNGGEKAIATNTKRGARDTHSYHSSSSSSSAHFPPACSPSIFLDMYGPSNSYPNLL